MTELLAALVGAAVGAAAAWAAFAVQRRDALRPKLADAIAYMIMLRHSLDYALSRSMIGVTAEMLGHQYEGLPEGHTFSSIQAGINTAEHQLTSLYLQYPSHRTAEEIRRWLTSSTASGWTCTSWSTMSQLRPRRSSVWTNCARCWTSSVGCACRRCDVGGAPAYNRPRRGPAAGSWRRARSPGRSRSPTAGPDEHPGGGRRDLHGEVLPDVPDGPVIGEWAWRPAARRRCVDSGCRVLLRACNTPL